MSEEGGKGIYRRTMACQFFLQHCFCHTLSYAAIYVALLHDHSFEHAPTKRNIPDYVNGDNLYTSHISCMYIHNYTAYINVITINLGQRLCQIFMYKYIINIRKYIQVHRII